MVFEFYPDNPALIDPGTRPSSPSCSRCLRTTTATVMASPSDAHSATGGSGAAAAARSDLGDFLEKLDLNDDDFADVEIDEDDPAIQESVRWLALARVHTTRNFSPSGFYKDMRAAWNPTQPVWFHSVGPNRFVVQA